VTASTKSDEPINAAARVARMKGRVVLVGMVGMNIQRDRYYRKELDLRLSMSYGPGRYDPDYEERGRDYPFAYVRWTERRNMQAFLELVRDGSVTPRALITHRFDIQDAAKAYDLISSAAEPYLGIVISYPEDRASAPYRRLAVRQPRPRSKPAKGGIGFIGAGNFARSVLLPHLRKIEGVRLTGVATATGLTCTRAAEKFGFAYATTDHRDLLRDPDTDTVFIVTRHDTHAPLACEALAAGKNIFVEKPLAIDREQLGAVIEAAQTSEGRLMVGFNRRFAPLVREAKQALAGRTAPLVMLYRINAGPLPPESWIGGEEGGGRIVGEVCHFIDTLQFLADNARPVSVHAVQAVGHPDAVSIQLAFEDGSIGTIVYSSLGDPSFPKEYIEVFGAGRVITIDDFRAARFVVDGRSTRRRLLRQNKGFDAAIRHFLESVRSGSTSTATLLSLVDTTEATFAAATSLSHGTPVRLGE
jgi:predicted dehydrogenase